MSEPIEDYCLRVARVHPWAETAGTLIKSLKAENERLPTEHPADENEPVTEEFVVSLKPPRYWEAGCEYAWPDVGLRYAVKIGDGRPPVLAAGFYLDAASGPVYLRHIKTRGEARALLEALGVSHG